MLGRRRKVVTNQTDSQPKRKTIDSIVGKEAKRTSPKGKEETSEKWMRTTYKSSLVGETQI
jgi:hypothetical protein